MSVTRRWVVAGGAASAGALAVSTWPPPVKAQGGRTRYNATSANGKLMLGKYAKAVDIMQNQIPAGHPLHWRFQWNTHWIPGPQSPWSAVTMRKQQMIAQVYGSAPPSDPHRMLAEAMWDTCQAHGMFVAPPGMFDEIYFLPWHRYFVYYFEDAIRTVLNDDTFTLPYWDYLSGNVADLSIPPEFYTDASSPLFRPNRNPWANQGQRIDFQNPGSMNLDAFDYSEYTSDDGQFGFCPTLDNNPHGLVHSYTGNGTNMGSVPTAAGDPVFWIHHANIDRLWASWTRLGNSNPKWENYPFAFTFADAKGQEVVVDSSGADTTEALGYDYDAYYEPLRLRPITRIFRTKQLFVAPGPPVEALRGLMLNTSEPTIVTLALTDAARADRALFALEGKTAIFLRLEGVAAMEGFPGTYNLYLDNTDGKNASGPDSPFYVGTFGSFMIAGHGDMKERNSDQAATGEALVFYATRAVAALAVEGKLPEAVKLIFQPRGDIEMPPVVGAVSLVYG